MGLPQGATIPGDEELQGMDAIAVRKLAASHKITDLAAKDAYVEALRELRDAPARSPAAPPAPDPPTSAPAPAPAPAPTAAPGHAPSPAPVAAAGPLAAEPEGPAARPRANGVPRTGSGFSDGRRGSGEGPHHVCPAAAPAAHPPPRREVPSALREFCDVVPVRLNEEERVLRRLLVSALDVSEYTDVVDDQSSYYRESHIKQELLLLYNTMLGLNINASGKTGRSLLCKAAERATDPDWIVADRDCCALFADLFELGRRYKRMNPDKMRTQYGKLICIMQDANRRTIMDKMKRMNVNKPVRTVASELRTSGLEQLLTDPDVAALAGVSDEAPTGPQRQALLRALLERHTTEGEPEARRCAELCIRSIDDAVEFCRACTGPLRRLRDLLQEYFHPRDPHAKAAKIGREYADLTIRRGLGGSCLSHSSDSQYQYVLESLTLWLCIMDDMFTLWRLAEEDMLDHERDYYFRNTGQGYHRVKGAPRVALRMRQHVQAAQRKMDGRWVGIQVVHLGDNDVPNALVFIDKYTQVPRIVGPIVQVVDSLDRIARLPGQQEYLDRKFGSVEKCKVSILQDFFKHGFDGSGDDGGSCIDGRLTSAWNWCQRLPKKPFYHAFLLAGFQSFDGQW
eukprot:TRINITY_DN9575_c0_g1_i1.p1 TRINITY_DN9575_c0_g1~~TRINITY_DN9575_c0_g1_i1.p1  ORF type:complete len:625 (+),score=206.59 TRINITY_DN9575_c0_g1_i1:84-1958(+)